MSGRLNEINRRILLVDDEETLHQSYRQILSRANAQSNELDDLENEMFGDGQATEAPGAADIAFELDSAHQGEQALSMVQQALTDKRPYAMAFVDMRMPPGWDGLETIKRIWEVAPDLQIAICSAYTDYAWKDVVNQLGHSDRLLILKKPFENIEVFQMASSLTEKWTLTQAANLQRHQLEHAVEERTAKLNEQNKILDGLQKQANASLRDTVVVLASMLEMFSPSLGIHCRRVADISKRIARHLDVSSDRIQEIEFSAHLHDIGKIADLADPNRIKEQSKKSWNQGQFHYAERGYAILGRISGFKPIAQAIRHQCECYDGSGFPKRLSGNKIPIISRIISIASAYDDAIFSSSSPTDPDQHQGVNMLKVGCGTVFDPNLVKILLDDLASDGDISQVTQTEVELAYRQLREGMMLTRDLRNVDQVLLLKAGTTLNADLIYKIRDLCQNDLLLSGIFVKPETQKKPAAPTDENDQTPPAPVDDAA